MNILVIDDERARARALGRYLERRGFITTLAHTAIERLALAQEVAPDVVLVDMRLPDMDGLKCADACGRWVQRKMGDMILIALSAYERDRVVEATGSVPKMSTSPSAAWEDRQPCPH